MPSAPSLATLGELGYLDLSLLSLIPPSFTTGLPTQAIRPRAYLDGRRTIPGTKGLERLDWAGVNSQPFFFASSGGPSAQSVHVGYLLPAYACSQLVPERGRRRSRRRRNRSRSRSQFTRPVHPSEEEEK